MKLLASRIIALALLANSVVAEVRPITGDANNQIFKRDAFLLDMSTDGKLVLFASGPPTTGVGPIPPGIPQGGLYIRDLAADTLTFTGAADAGGEGSLSDDGRYIAWTTPNFLINWRDCQANETRALTAGADGACRNPIISANGRYVAYVSVARNLVTDAAKLPAPGRAAVYLYDSETAETKVISLTYQGKGLSTGVGLHGPQFEFDFSADGRYVFFSTDAADVHPSRATANQAFYWVYRRNLMRGGVDVVGKNASGAIPAGNFTSPRSDTTGNRVSFAGSFIGLGGGATLVPNYSQPFATDIYLKDLTSSEVWLISKTRDNSASDGFFSGPAVINGNGSVVAFGSSGTKFVQENTDPNGNSSMDIFRVDVGANGATTTTLISKAAQGNNNVDFLTGPFMPGSGDYVAFVTSSLLSTVGQGTDNSFFKHGVAVGNFPATQSKPKLGFSVAASQLKLSWPDTAGFLPEYSDNLAPGVWAPLTAPAVANNGLNSISLTLENRARFFRLRRAP